MYTLLRVDNCKHSFSQYFNIFITCFCKLLYVLFLQPSVGVSLKFLGRDFEVNLRTFVFGIRQHWTIVSIKAVPFYNIVLDSLEFQKFLNWNFNNWEHFYIQCCICSLVQVLELADTRFKSKKDRFARLTWERLC